MNGLVVANPVVTKDIPEYTIAIGAPAKVIKPYNKQHVFEKWYSRNRSHCMVRYYNKICRILAYLLTMICYKQIFKSIGSKTIIYPCRRIMGPQNISIGNNVVIEKDATLYSVSKHIDKIYNGKILIGNNVYINYGFNATSANHIEIQNDVLIAYNVSLFDFDHDYEDITKNINQTDLIVKGKIVIGEKSWLGMNVAVLGNVTIGKHCVIAANSVVTKDIPSYSIASGNPAKIIKQYKTETQKWERLL